MNYSFIGFAPAAIGRAYCTLMCARLISSAVWAAACLMNAANSEGEDVAGARPLSFISLAISGVLTAIAISLLIWLRIGAGVPAGAHTPNQALA